MVVLKKKVIFDTSGHYKIIKENLVLILRGGTSVLFRGPK